MAKRPFPSFLIFRDQQGHWGWNFAGPGGRILAKSAQSYTASQGCVRAIRLLKGSSEIPVVGSPEVREAVNESRAAAAKAQAASPGGKTAVEKKAATPGKASNKAETKKKV